VSSAVGSFVLTRCRRMTAGIPRVGLRTARHVDDRRLAPATVELSRHLVNLALGRDVPLQSLSDLPRLEVGVRPDAVEEAAELLNESDGQRFCVGAICKELAVLLQPFAGRDQLLAGRPCVLDQSQALSEASPVKVSVAESPGTRRSVPGPLNALARAIIGFPPTACSRLPGVSHRGRAEGMV
jgi:hypothetical protein